MVAACVCVKATTIRVANIGNVGVVVTVIVISILVVMVPPILVVPTMVASRGMYAALNIGVAI